jgi:hypothetical protein
MDWTNLKTVHKGWRAQSRPSDPEGKAARLTYGCGQTKISPDLSPGIKRIIPFSIRYVFIRQFV